MGNKGTPGNQGGSRKQFKPASKKEPAPPVKKARAIPYPVAILLAVIALITAYLNFFPPPTTDRDAFPDTANPTTAQWNVTNNSRLFSMYNVEFVCTVDANFKDGSSWTNNVTSDSTVAALPAGNKTVENCLFKNIGADWDKLRFLKVKMDIRYRWFWLLQCNKTQNAVGYKQDNGTFIWNFV